jgi:hypothetical protein
MIKDTERVLALLNIILDATHIGPGYGNIVRAARTELSKIERDLADHPAHALPILPVEPEPEPELELAPALSARKI